MPAFRYTCADCGSNAEVFLKYKYDPQTKETNLQEVTHCGQAEVWLDAEWNEMEGCGSQNIYKQLPRSFGISGESTGSGCDARGYFSASLGRYVKSRKEEGQIMEKAGFVPLSDLGGDKWYDDAVNKQKEKVAQQDALESKYQSLVASGKSKEDAVMETWTAKDAVSGNLDKIYDSSIKH